MFYCPYAQVNEEGYRVKPNTSYIRVFHAAPESPRVDVYSNGRLIAKNISYRNFSVYLPIMPGINNIKVFVAGKVTNPIINYNFNVPNEQIFTLAVIGEGNNVSLLPIVEPRMTRTPGKVYVRFAHLSPNTPNVNFTLTSGTTLFKDIQYKEVSEYASVNPGTYNFEIRAVSNNERILYIPNIRLIPNRIYTIYAVGLSGGTPPLQVVIPLDGNTYL